MNPILIDLPQDFNTERLFIRMAMPGDGNVVYDAMNASRKDLNKWLEFALYEQSLDQVEQMVREAHIHFLQRIELRFHIFHKKTGDFIGSTSLHHINWNVPAFEIGYWIDSRKSGNGYMLEAVEGLTFYAFYALHANRVEIQCDSKNVKSRAIPERLGYTLEGTLRNASVSIDREELRDSCIYAKIRE
ncbi:GNAT family N-acetyltransferase [Oceanobacillus chungangensis]|uniref:GNAT family N-acetyltransferase n=1 Tax=Oceanobacillus chungangensis TaxID=1229152 RepID=A0A3D8PG95_9BACI|nr:GNAT family N-acetyltransferase [Oceanobacillus chungangensis]RDW15103.1 GNAT family N-acetyltransferase [Oceanobacillus chungangensis]